MNTYGETHTGGDASRNPLGIGPFPTEILGAIGILLKAVMNDDYDENTISDRAEAFVMGIVDDIADSIAWSGDGTVPEDDQRRVAIELLIDAELQREALMRSLAIVTPILEDPAQKAIREGREAIVDRMFHTQCDLTDFFIDKYLNYGEWNYGSDHPDYS